MNPGQLRVSDADRDQVAEVLHTAYAEGRISLDEHAERTSAALEAKTFDDLTGLTADLVPTAAAQAASRGHLSLVPDSRRAGPDHRDAGGDQPQGSADRGPFAPGQRGARARRWST